MEQVKIRQGVRGGGTLVFIGIHALFAGVLGTLEAAEGSFFVGFCRYLGFSIRGGRGEHLR